MVTNTLQFCVVGAGAGVGVSSGAELPPPPHATTNTVVKIENSMVVTIEPGIYISSKSSVDEKWKGIGVRIEDNILVTDQGNENLTQSAPVDPKEIEALMSS